MKSNKKLSLSAAGQKRQAAMRGELQAAFSRHHRNRKRQKVVMASVACVAFGVVSFVLFRFGFVEPNRQDLTPTPIAGLERGVTEFPHVSMEFISDEELLEMLEEIGRPSILAKVDGKKMAIPCRRESQN